MGTQRDAFGQVKGRSFTKPPYFSRYTGDMRMRLDDS